MSSLSSPSQPAHLTFPVKLAYGLGLAAEGVKNGAFNIFLLFFYQQLVGLDPVLCGVALFLSLCVDAVADPAIGVWSDGTKSRFGRRHPFMYVAILPLAISFYAVFVPPAGLSQVAKFAWLATFATLTRFSMALFVIPHQSLVPELTTDSRERTTLTSLRTVFAWIFGLINSVLAYGVFLKGTLDHPQGLLNPAGYPKLATFGACTMAVAMLISAIGTQAAALRVQPDASRVHEISILQLPKEIIQAMRRKSYRVSVLAGIALFVGYGLAENMNNYMNTFFWGFTSEQLGTFIYIIFFASMLVMGSARSLVHRFGNRKVGIWSGVLMNVLTPVFVLLQVAGVLPHIGDPVLFKWLAVSTFISYAALIMGMVVIGTMTADVTDEHELETGARQEGLLFSANMFMSKAASGIGVLVSGLIIKLANFPEGATRETLDPAVLRNLGLFAAGGSILFGALIVVFFAKYDLTRAKHDEIVAELARRKQARAEPAPAPSVVIEREALSTQNATA